MLTILGTALGSYKVAKKFIAMAKRACFVAGTPVWTADGMRPIEDIRVGDLVVSRDEITQQTTLKPVVRVFKRTMPQILHLSLEKGDGKIETLGTTTEHPFHVPGRGFVAAGDLRPGDLVTSGGRLAQSPLLLVASKENDASGFLRVKSLELEDRSTPVYNFEVADTHTYFVGQTKAWVHNACWLALVNNKKWMDANGNYKWINPETGKLEVIDPKKYPKIAGDHLFPQKEIWEIDGFKKLPKEVRDALLQDPDNLMPMPKGWNSSKGGKLAGNWTKYAKEGKDIHPDYQRFLAKKEADMRKKISDAIEANK